MGSLGPSVRQSRQHIDILVLLFGRILIVANCVLGDDIVDSFLQKHDLDLVCRAHQVIDANHRFYFCDVDCTTLFSSSQQIKNTINETRTTNATSTRRRTTGGRGRLRVLRATPARDDLLRAQLLRRIRQQARRIDDMFVCLPLSQEELCCVSIAVQ